ncbi:hypothetical protein MMC13_008495 [Lambiella insularis]|nr:hypothetical protein [Lambiella insularis]
MNTQHSTSATLRPRNRRLISIDDDFETLESISSPPRSNAYESATSSFFSSRAASPLPSTHPSRSASNTRSAETLQLNNRSPPSFALRESPASPAGSIAGFWGSSWSSIQGIASTLLGNEVQVSPKDKPFSARPLRKKKPPEATHSRKLTATSSAEWGPSVNVESHVAYGSQEDRLAQVQAKKREALLSSNGHMLHDSTRNHKRRISEDRECLSAPPSAEHDRDALVYLHHVQPNDTLAGVSIRYNCPITVLRKANRLWTNDSIQIRDTIYLPVDSCGVKGRKVPEPAANLNLMGDGPGSNDDSAAATTPTAARPWFDPLPNHQSPLTSSLATSPSATTTNSNPDDPPWKHDSWVIIDSSPIAIEIARLPRRTLGFFPPSRRKSVGYSDTATPSISFELSCPPETGPSSIRNNSPRRYSSPRRSNKSRSSSISAFASTLTGPGGVGTLGKDIRSPGPAQDKLNQLFAPHLPNVAPRTSFDSVHSTSSTGIENVGGAIEGWMRKMATKAASAVQTPPLGGRRGEGDLIELVEGWELDGESGDTDTITGKRDERADEERMLSERFPVKGRVFEDRGKKKGN